MRALESNPATWLADLPGKISSFRLRVAIRVWFCVELSGLTLRFTG